MVELARQALALAKRIQEEGPTQFVPPSAGTTPATQMVLPHSLVLGTRGYIERICYQMNGCYEKGWYDAGAVMMRRLLETLIIEAFEHNGIAHKIKNAKGDFLYLGDLIGAALTEPSWNLGRNSKGALPRLKDIGDQSAHSRRFTAHREDIDRILHDFRTVAQEFCRFRVLCG